MYGSQIVGCGSWLPTNLVSNYDLENNLETSHKWIIERTGIKFRHIAADHISTSDMGILSVRKLIQSTVCDKVEAIVVATTTSEQNFPSVACKIQKAIFPHKTLPAFDVQAACSGFIYGLEMADSLIKANKYQSVLLICTEKMSSIVNWQDRNTCVLFADGASSVLIEKVQDNNQSKIIDTIIESDGTCHDALVTNIDISGKKAIHMEGQNVFKRAVLYNEKDTKKNDINLEEIIFFIPHQANKRIIDCTAKMLHIKEDKVV